MIVILLCWVHDGRLFRVWTMMMVLLVVVLLKGVGYSDCDWNWKRGGIESLNARITISL